jgi:hypothetical protein
LAAIGTDKMTQNDRQQLSKKLLEMNLKLKDKNLKVQSGHRAKRKNLTAIDSRSIKNNISSFLEMSQEMAGDGLKLPKIRKHFEQAPQLLENKMPTRISKKEFIQKLENNMGKKPGLHGHYSSFDNQNLNNEVSINLFNHSKNKNMKSIHDKFHNAIRFDSNWGVSSKVGSEFSINMKNKKHDINYRRIR